MRTLLVSQLSDLEKAFNEDPDPMVSVSYYVNSAGCKMQQQCRNVHLLCITPKQETVIDFTEFMARVACLFWNLVYASLCMIMLPLYILLRHSVV